MDRTFIYRSGKPSHQPHVESILDAITDQVLTDGDVEKALERTFRFGTQEDMGLLDILERLREDSHNLDHAELDSEQHTFKMDSGSAERRAENAAAMRDALRQVESLDDLQGLDPDLLSKALSIEEREWVEKWSDMQGLLIESGLVAMSGPRLMLTAKAIRFIGSKLLQHMFLPPVKRGRGSHQLNVPGLHGMPGDDTAIWEWGKPLDLNIGRTLTNAVKRTHHDRRTKLHVDDFEIFERESGAGIHTVLLTDMSRSMFESGAWDAAKKSAIALNTLVETGRHHDHLDLVGFSGDARVLDLEELPMLTWDQFSHGTNLHAGLLVASQQFRRRHALNQQVVIITDGEPTAFMDGSSPVFEHPVTHRTFDATLLQARRMSRKGINVTTICVGDFDSVPQFTQTLSKTINARLILLPTDALGTFLVRDVATGAIRTIH